jgi:hypothetical protein
MVLADRSEALKSAPVSTLAEFFLGGIRLGNHLIGMFDAAGTRGRFPMLLARGIDFPAASALRAWLRCVRG